MNINKKENDDDILKDGFFKEENPKNIIIKVALGVTAILVVFLAVLLLLLANNKDKSEVDSRGINETIIDYSENEPTDSIKVVLDDNDDTEFRGTPIRNSDVIIDRSENVAPKVQPTPKEEIMPTPTPIKEVMELDAKDYSKVKFDAKSNLHEIEAYFDQDNWEAIDDLVHLDRFLAMSYDLRNTKNHYYYGDVNEEGEPHGKGVAVYADNQYYFGEWKDGVRHGNGTWIHFHIHLKKNTDDIITYHQFVGEFANDLPNGNGQDHYEYDSSMLEKNRWYITNYMGGYKDGLIDGEIYCTANNKEGGYCDYYGTAHSGKLDICADVVDQDKKSPVLYGRENHENYIWMSTKENFNIGVSSYISKNK